MKGGRDAEETNVSRVVQCHDRDRGSLSSGKCHGNNAQWVQKHLARNGPVWRDRCLQFSSTRVQGWGERPALEVAGEEARAPRSQWGNIFFFVGAETVTNYEGHDPDCKPHVYTKGMGFVDPGGDHVHVLRNEGDVEARTIAVQLIPADASRRIDVADPGNCHF